MTGVLLDIGAGGTNFVRLFRTFNPSYKLVYLCGEPKWKGQWSGRLRAKQIKKICASYNQFNVPDASLHFVTLNAYFPFISLTGLQEELIRTLIPSGGVFISAQPAGHHPKLSDKYFYQIGFVQGGTSNQPKLSSSFTGSKGLWGTPVSTMTIDRLPRLHYPASRTIRSRLRELQSPVELRTRSAMYCYTGINTGASIRVWLRNEVPAP